MIEIWFWLFAIWICYVLSFVFALRLVWSWFACLRGFLVSLFCGLFGPLVIGLDRWLLMIALHYASGCGWRNSVVTFFCFLCVVVLFAFTCVFVLDCLLVLLDLFSLLFCVRWVCIVLVWMLLFSVAIFVRFD